MLPLPKKNKCQPTISKTYRVTYLLHPPDNTGTSLMKSKHNRRSDPLYSVPKGEPFNLKFKLKVASFVLCQILASG